MMQERETDSGWVGADPDDDLDAVLEAELESIPVGAPYVDTALGPIVTGALGPMLAAESVSVLLGDDPDGRDVALAELEDAYNSGIRSIGLVARTPAEADEVYWLAQRTRLHVVPLHLQERDGVAVVVHEAGSAVLLDPHEPLAHATHLGAVEWVIVPCSLIAPGEWADLLTVLRDRGSGDRIVLTAGLEDPEACIARGGAFGLGGVLERVPLRLMDAGWSAAAIRQLVVEHPATWVARTWGA